MDDDPVRKLVTIILKKEWGGEFAKALIPFEKDIDTLRFVETGTPLCKTKEECITQMQKMQEEDFQNEGWDVKYNFYIGGDGSVFEGRGWNVISWKPEELQDLKYSCLDIAYIINTKEAELTPEMKDAAEKLVKMGIEEEFIPEEHLVINLGE